MDQASGQSQDQNQNRNSKKFITYFIYFLFIVAFLWVSGELFLRERINNAYDFLRSGIFVTDNSDYSPINDLRVIYPDVAYSLEPTIADPSIRQRLVNIYEPLVKQDRYLDMEPGLALSWGLLDDYTWEFNLQPDVYFHDGSTFGPEDVLASIERAKENKDSELSDFLSTIEKVEIIDDMKVLIRTFEPDPLLLDKLSFVLIIPSEHQNKDLSKPIGTGSYEFDSIDEKSGEIVIKRFENYWRETLSKFKTVRLISIKDKSERVLSLVEEDAELLTFVPMDAASVLKDRDFPIVSVPTLEVQFLLFNLSSDLMSDVEVRKIISLAMDQKSLVELLGIEYVKPLNQFVSNGVFGFNPGISDHVYDPKLAYSLASESELTGRTVQVHLPIGLDILGELVRKNLGEVGLSPIISYLELDSLLESMDARDADIYFMGFKSALGDSVEFFNSMIHSHGDFNVFSYKSDNMDFLIDTALHSFDGQRRLDHLQEAMRIIVEDEYVGVPLFEYESLFSFSDAIDMRPRIDGLVYFDDLIVK